MITYNRVPLSGDPSNRLQSFLPLNFSVLCCRYWWLQKWKSHEMSFPYWRLYWNKTKGAYVKNIRKVDLSPDKLILIPPNTVFSTDIDYKSEDSSYSDYDLVGNYINGEEEERLYLKQEKILHFFVHFNLGNQLDNIKQDVYSVDIDEENKQRIEAIIKKLFDGMVSFDASASLEIYQLILFAINKIDANVLVSRKIEHRAQQLLDYIDNNVDKNLKNTILAQEMNMATNSFTRFFRQQLKCSPQQYIRKVRIAKACDLLYHSSLTIDQISVACGFPDRFHFSKTFKKEKGIAPAEYKKKFIVQVAHQ